MAYCRNCGKELATDAAICVGCGVIPPKGDKFCQNCGNGTDPIADVCINCGVRLARWAPVQARKSKTAAILLAVFLAYWTWLYTYKRNAWKFWVGASITAVFIGLTIWGFVNMIDYSYYDSYRGEDLPPGFGYVLVIMYGGWFIGFGLWLWALLDACLRPEEWYKSY